EQQEAARPPSRIASQLVLVTAARVGMLALWFIATMIVARSLGPSSYGVYALCLTGIKIFTGIFGDALDLAILREVPLYLRDDRPRATHVMHVSLWLRVAISV